MSETKQLTREQAETCLKIVDDWLSMATGGAQWGPKLYEPGFHCNGWAIALEGGPEDWPWHVSQEGIWPKDVFVEPGSSWYLGLYLK